MFNIVLVPWYMLRAFAITIFFETGIALISGVRKKRDIAIVILAQAVTNPLLVITLILINLYCNFTLYCVAVAVLELLAFLSEGLIYRSVLGFKKINPFVFSFILNACSFSAGIVINHLFS